MENVKGERGEYKILDKTTDSTTGQNVLHGISIDTKEDVSITQIPSSDKVKQKEANHEWIITKFIKRNPLADTNLMLHYDIAEGDGSVYVIKKHIKETLADCISKIDLNEYQIIKVLRQVLFGMKTLIKMSICFNDLHAKNILISGQISGRFNSLLTGFSLITHEKFKEENYASFLIGKLCYHMLHKKEYTTEGNERNGKPEANLSKITNFILEECLYKEPAKREPFKELCKILRISTMYDTDFTFNINGSPISPTKKVSNASINDSPVSLTKKVFNYKLEYNNAHFSIIGSPISPAMKVPNYTSEYNDAHFNKKPKVKKHSSLTGIFSLILCAFFFIAIGLSFHNSNFLLPEKPRVNNITQNGTLNVINSTENQKEYRVEVIQEISKPNESSDAGNVTHTNATKNESQANAIPEAIINQSTAANNAHNTKITNTTTETNNDSIIIDKVNTPVDNGENKIKPEDKNTNTEENEKKNRKKIIKKITN